MMNNYEEFLNWYKNDFIVRNGGFSPRNIQKWLEEIKKNHGDLIGLIGSDKIQKKYILKSHQNPAKPEDVQDIVDKITKLIPSYLPTYKYDQSVFLKPLIQTGSHNFTKTSKHVIGYASKELLYRNKEYSEIQKLISELGNIWSRYRTSDTELEVTLSYTPKAFALIGHYGPDHDSCFRQGSSSQKDKYSFGQSKNTYVLTISQLDTHSGKNKNVARMLGFANDQLTVFNFFNYYCNKQFRDGDTQEVVRLLVGDLLCSPVEVIEDHIGIAQGVHFNVGGLNLSYYKKDSSFNVETLIPNCHLISNFICPRCSDRFDSDRDWLEIDNEYVCRYCMHNANVCELTLQRTFKPLLQLDDNGHIMDVHPSLKDKYKQCQDCHILNNNLIEEKCQDCHDLTHTECDICGQERLDEEIKDIGYLSICTTCLKDKKEEIELELQGELCDI